MTFRRMRMVAAPEPADAGGAPGGGGAPAGVRSPAPPAGDSNPFPHTFAPQPRGGAPRPGADDGGDADELDTLAAQGVNAIPHTRVREMISKREERARKAAREEALREARESFSRDFSPMLEELNQLRGLAGQFDPASIKQGIAESFLESLGVKKEKPPPQYVTREEYEAGLKKEREQLHREAKHQQDLQRADLELRSAKQRHAKYFQHFPVLEEAAAAIWSTPYSVEKGISFGTIVDALVQQIEKGIGAYNQAYVEGKRRDAHEAPITPGTAPAPGRRPPEKVDHSPEGTQARAIKFLEEAGL